MTQTTKGKKKNTKVKKKVSKVRKVFKIILLTLVSIIILSVATGAGIILAIIKTAPSIDINQLLDLKETSVIYDDKGNRMDDVIVTDENGQVVKRTVVALKDTSPYLGKAIVAIEDERFYQHDGVDFKGVTRAVILDVQNKLFHKNQSIQGASTITQQLIKNRIFLDDSLVNRLDYKRKIQEAYLALELEKKLSKNEILEAYMNTIFLGGNAHGVEAAANQYFNKSAKDLTLLESAFIAGVAQSPSYFYPFTLPAKKDHSIYLNKTKLVLGKMLETLSISQKEYDDAMNEMKAHEIVFNRPTQNSDKYSYEYFSRPVVEQIKTDLMAQYGYTKTQVMSLFMNGGISIYTTMDKDLEDKTIKILNSDPTFNKVDNTSKNPLQASAVVMDYHNGEVKAMVGGRGEQPPGSFNRAIDNVHFPRSTGSSIKPITVYSAAIDTKQATAATLIDDTKLSPALVSKYKFDPQDDDGAELGPITVRSAIMQSRNLVAVKLEDKIGLDTGAEYAGKFGIQIKPSDKLMSTLALGQFSKGTNPYYMAAAYGVFGNSGMYASPRLYTKVVDRTGKVLLETKYTTKKAIDASSAYVMYDLLKGPVSSGGTGPNARFGDMPVAGKTGTATDLKDLWFCGLTPYYSGSVWLGNDDYKKFYGLSSNDAALIWGNIMKEANANLEIKDIPQPESVVNATVCLDSGKIPTSLCTQDPRGDRSYSDIFIAGTEPTEVCDQHVQVKINKTNGKLATDTTPAASIELKIMLRSQVPTEYDDPKVVIPITPSPSPSPDPHGNKNKGDHTLPPLQTIPDP